MEDYPTFEQAVEQFRSFLKSEGLPEGIAWLNPEDAALVGTRILVRPPTADAAWERAAREYSRGCGRRLGVELGVVCRIDGRVCCFIYIPQNEDEAERRMMPDGLKFHHPLPVPDGRIVEGRLEWLVVGLCSRRWRRRSRSWLFHRED